MADSSFTSNADNVIKEAEKKLIRAAEIIGGTAESYAKKLCRTDTGNLKNSITHVIENKNDEVIVAIGSNVEYAPYVELGTGIHAEDGNGRQTPWRYKDRKGKWHTTSGMKPKPFLRPAIEDHKEEYKHILRNES